MQKWSFMLHFKICVTASTYMCLNLELPDEFQFKIYAKEIKLKLKAKEDKSIDWFPLIDQSN